MSQDDAELAELLGDDSFEVARNDRGQVGIEGLWSTYFPGEKYSKNDAKVSIIGELIDFFAQDYVTHFEPYENSGVIVMDFQILTSQIPVGEFESVFKANTEMVTGCLALACHIVIRNGKLRPDAMIASKFLIRLSNFSPCTPIRQIKSNVVDRFVAVKGNVVRVSSIRPLVLSMQFECVKCGTPVCIKFKDGEYSPPMGQCENKCKGRSWTPLHRTAKVVDFQVIRVQEILNSDQLEHGRIPRTLDCELRADLVDACIPGDVCTVSGVVRSHTITSTKIPGQNQRTAKVHNVLYLDVNYLSKSAANEQDGNSKLELTVFSDIDLRGIVRVRTHPTNIKGEPQSGASCFRNLVHSVCPSIYGHDIVKAGLLLTLLGGSKHDTHKNRIPTRSDSHLMIVGDPGLGKSQMLKAVSQISPRGVYVTGNVTTSSGLTVTMQRDGKGGEYALEAGALLLADQGACCIDEFDKMRDQQDALLEVMEQQTISIAKSGIVCTLSAKTSVIAAANPVAGHYDMSKTVNENLKMSTPLTSRFDLIFILMDRPNEERDRLLTEHVIALHSGRRAPSTGRSEASQMRNFADQSQGSTGINSSFVYPRDSDKDMNITKNLGAEKLPLAGRLRMSTDERTQHDPVPHWLLRKYIAYARKYCNPVMSDPAKQVLREFFLNLRAKYASCVEGTPITARQLESMVRLAEARAKAELATEVTAAHARDVVDIMKESLYDVFADEKAIIQPTRMKGASRAKQKKELRAYLQKKAEKDGEKKIHRNYIIKVAQSMGITDPDAVIDALCNQDQCLLQQPNGFYKLY